MRRSRPAKKRVAVARPRRRDLTREKIIETALTLVDEGGANTFSMRALAERVGVTPMALYNHFSNRRDLLAAVANDAIGAVNFQSDHADWRDRVRHCFDALRNLCLEHPGLPGILEGEGIAPPSVFGPMEVTVRALKDAGLDDLGSMRTYFLLMSFTLGQAAYQSRGPIGDLEAAQAARDGRLEGRGYDTMASLQMPLEWDFDTSFAFGIRLVLDGVQALTRSSQQKHSGAMPRKKK